MLIKMTRSACLLRLLAIISHTMSEYILKLGLLCRLQRRATPSSPSDLSPYSHTSSSDELFSRPALSPLTPSSPSSFPDISESCFSLVLHLTPHLHCCQYHTQQDSVSLVNCLSLALLPWQQHLLIQSCSPSSPTLSVNGCHSVHSLLLLLHH